jgi:hypothetical protein
MPKKCVVVHLPEDLLAKINEQKEKTGKNQGAFIIDLIEKGLDYKSNENLSAKIFFFVKVRIDTKKMFEFGKKLQSGEIDTSHTLMTYCNKEDPTVGLNFWWADSQEDFEKRLNQYKPFYNEILEITPVITPMNAMKIISEKIKEK